MMPKDCNIVGLSIKRSQFFRFWVETLKPIIKLTNKESDVFAAFLSQRFELNKVITDEAILNDVLMSEDTRQKIKDSCNMTTAHFRIILCTLRKKKLIVDGKVNKKYMPDLTPDFNSFRLIFAIDINEDKGEV